MVSRFLLGDWLGLGGVPCILMTTKSTTKNDTLALINLTKEINYGFSAHDKKIKKSDKTRHNSNFFDELNHAKSYQT